LQLTSFFQSRGIQPLRQQLVNEANIEVEEEEPEIDLTLNFDEEEIVVSRGGLDYSHW
jgi:hypothetical protein